MIILFCISLVFLPLTGEVQSSRDVEKYGCVFSPDLCVPPRNCNGVTGTCQLPTQENDRGYNEGDRDIARVLRAIESYGHTNPKASDFDANYMVVSHRDSHKKASTVSRTTTPGKPNSWQTDAVKDMSGRQSKDTQLRIKKHLDEFQSALAKRGKKLSDLTPDDLRLLVRYLANVIRNEQTHSVRDSSQLDLGANHKNKGFDVKNSFSVDEHPMHAVPKSIDPVPQGLNDGAVLEVASDNDNAGAQMEVKEDRLSQPQLKSANEPTSRPTDKSKIQKDTLYIVLIVVGSTVLLIIVVTILSCAYYTYKKKKQEEVAFIRQMASKAPVGSEYQDLCRQHYASRASEVKDDSDSDVAMPGFSVVSTNLLREGAGLSKQERNGDFDPTPKDSSVSSWSEEPTTAVLDIATGHMVWEYMENHLDNKDRLAQEWYDLANSATDEFDQVAAESPQNRSKNRNGAALPYDYNRVKLKVSDNHVNSDYINASKITDSDPKRPLYIAAQGPLPSTIPDFWQMVWEQDCVAIVMLTALAEEGVNQCARYWPDEGSSKYHNFEIKLVSEHIWCEHYLVRSLYLKHTATKETRTVTQFHFLSWLKNGVPSTPKHLLEMRRKVSKCSKAHHSPVLVHCSDGIGRTGTYILFDLAINRLLKRPMEIDIAATLEHIRDLRPGMVANKDQFEFALTAVAEEVSATLKTPAK